MGSRRFGSTDQRRQRVSRANDDRTRRFSIEPLEPRRLLAGLVISEFLASNDNDLRDEDRNRTDWIEILNTSAEERSLDGWFLTDDPSDLDQWQFPDIRLTPNERVVVFASEKGRSDPSGELHTNFRLSVAGEYLALVQPDGVTVEFDFGPAYPRQIKDVSYGLPQPTSHQTVVTPGTMGQLFVPTSDNGGDGLGTAWTQADFDDSQWSDAVAGIGYERKGGYEDHIVTDVGAAMFDINTSLFVRMPFTLDNPDSVFSMRLELQYEDGFVAYVNGQELVRRNAPDSVAWNSAATNAHADRLAVVPETIPIDVAEFPRFLAKDNVLAIHALNDDIQSSDFLLVPTLSVDTFGQLQTAERQYFAQPSPGIPNDLGSSTVAIEASHTPRAPALGDELTVNATVVATGGELRPVNLHYRVMFGEEQTISMRDDGQHGDGEAADGVYGATIPADVAAPGQMIRYRITVGNEGNESRLPIFTDPLNTEQYFGTVVIDPSIESNLEVLHLFLEDPDASQTNAGTHGSLFHGGVFYDNIHIDTTGRTVGLAGPKKSHDIFFPSDHWFELSDQGFRMNDFDIINDFWNRAKVRVPLGYQTFGMIGSPSHYSIPVRVQRNGEFYATYSFVDGGNEQFLTRAGLNPEGALYKMNLGFATGRGQFKKQTRTHENTDDLRAFFAGLSLTGDELTHWLIDNVNIPAVTNYLVGLVAMGHGDCCGKNLYLYRDTTGTGEWETLPWDVDSAFGRGGVGRAQPIFPSAAGIFTGRGNPLIDALFTQVPGFRDMYLRRLRTVLDDLLQPPGTPADQLKFERLVDEMVEQMGPDALLDFEKWGTWQTDPETEKITYGKEGFPTWMDHVNILKFDYFPARRELLFRGLAGFDTHPQVGAPAIRFGQVVWNPESGNQDEEFIELTNPNDVAVDITGWHLDGGIQHTFRPGTVIPAGGKLYVSPNVNAFRARATGPSGGQGLRVQGNYVGHISNHGTTIRLVASNQQLVAEKETPRDLNALQQFLRVSEVMFHPRDVQDGDRFVDDDYEFLELVNTSSTDTLNLEGVQFTQGIQFRFDAVALAPNERVVIVRDRDAFISRYGPEIRIVGEYGHTAQDFKLGNGGEAIALEIAAGDLIQQFSYSDTWHPTTDGAGASLTVVDVDADLSRWSLPAGWQPSNSLDGSPGSSESNVGDFNSDGQVDESDIDLFCSGLRNGDTRFDLNADAMVDGTDLSVLIQDVLRTSPGDANLDQRFDSADLVQVFRSGEYEDAVNGNSTWSEGDWNCDGDFGSSDLVDAFAAGGYVAGAVQLAEARTLDAAVAEVARTRLQETSHDTEGERHVLASLRREARTDAASEIRSATSLQDDEILDGIFGGEWNPPSSIADVDELIVEDDWQRRDEQ